MKTRIIIVASLVATIFAPGSCLGQNGSGVLQVTFDEPPTLRPGAGIHLQEYFEAGMWFGRMPGSDGFGRQWTGDPRDPDNGTIAFLQATLGDTLSFGTNDTAFGLFSVDLAEYSTVVPDPVTVRFVGYRHDGSIVTSEVTTDGIMDGTGPLTDFQTFFFGPEFSNLDRVEIPTSGWSLDNLVVLVPEPGTWALIMAGGLLFGARHFRKGDTAQ